VFGDWAEVYRATDATFTGGWGAATAAAGRRRGARHANPAWFTAPADLSAWAISRTGTKSLANP